MRKLQTEVLVIGGGATGAGVVRDLAMRGFRAILVEKGDLTHGTTGRYHGLLHSGGRYVVRDPHAAVECIEENRVLRRIMPQCIEDTGGFFVLTPWDDPEYAPRFVAGCQKAGIPVEEVPIPQMLKEERLLNPNISLCYRVPDGSADAFLGADLCAASARQHKAQILHYHKVTSLLKSGDRVTGACCHDLVSDEPVEISADMIVNASGAWAGQIAGMVGMKVHIVPGKGTMIAVNHRIVNTVINRCKLPSDGDILVPAHTVAVIGTTDVKVESPDHYGIEPWEVHLMLEEGERIIPGFKGMRMLRAWAGVRPLYQETSVTDTRDVTRAFVLLDHAQRDGIEGIVTITSGKWTTYRKMAESTVDLVCRKLGVNRPCRTHLEPLPGPEKDNQWLGERLAHVEHHELYGKLVCECELATEADVTRAIVDNGAKTLDDIRRDVRLGMGPCQGGFCTFRAAGMLHALRGKTGEFTSADANVALRDFLQERWKGLVPILWGQQLRQERLDELIYLSVLNADHLPGPQASRLSSEPYAPSGEVKKIVSPEPAALPQPKSPPPGVHAAAAARDEVLVIGAGLSGLTAGWQLAQRGRKVRVIAKGWGALYWHTGCIDVLGYPVPYDADGAPVAETPVESPAKALPGLIAANPQHPYALAGLDAVRDSLEALQELCLAENYPLHGSLAKNWLLPSALGLPRPTCLAPETMIAGDMRRSTPMLIVGIPGFPDFYPEYIAANLTQHGIEARGLALKMPSVERRDWISGRILSAWFDLPEFRVDLANAIRSQAGLSVSPDLRIGLPAVLGGRNALQVLHHLQELLGCPVFEIPSLPPSIPGIRLSELLVQAIKRLGGRVFDGMQVSGSQASANRLDLVWSEASVRPKPNRAGAFVLATGGILGGGLIARYEGDLQETVCGLPAAIPPDRSAWFNPAFLSQRPHPLYTSGLPVNADFRPVDAAGRPVYDNVYAVGSLLGGCEPLRERSFDGVALVTGFTVGRSL